jgi:LysM repeat protein
LSRDPTHARLRLGRAARLTLAVGLGAAVVASLLALPATAQTALPASGGSVRAAGGGTVRLAAGTVRLVAARRPGRSTYVVRSGDTLSGIARAAGLPGWQSIVALNPVIHDPDLIYPGWRLVLPSGSEVHRTVSHRVVHAVHRSTVHRTVHVTVRHTVVRRHLVKRHVTRHVVRRHVVKRHVRRHVVRRHVRRHVVRRHVVRRRHRSASAGRGVWDRLASCESTGNWHANTGNGFAGGLQFSRSTWRAYGGRGSAASASRSAQIAVARRVLAGQGWRAWPSCSRRLGLR